jgi:hypothetical protein
MGLAATGFVSSAAGAARFPAGGLPPASLAAQTGSPLQLYQRIPSPPVESGEAKSFGSSVAVSGDGSIVLVGAPGVVGGPAAGAWVYERSGGSWVLQQRLTEVGGSVALSRDGTTALVGAPNTGVVSAPCQPGAGSALVFVRSGTTWTQQGTPLTPNDAQGQECPPEGFGSAVALSADGSTALIGSPSDAGYAGAAWVFARSGSTWTPQGPKLRPTGETGPGAFGTSLALSGDGATALIGAPDDGAPPLTQPNRHLGAGAAWTFTRSGSGWIQAQRLIPSDEVISEKGERGLYGSAVALSADGSTAMVGGEWDNTQGAAWVFTHSGSIWVLQGPKLLGPHESSGFGAALALSGTGDTAVIAQVPSGFASSEYEAIGWERGGPGVAWPFSRVGSTWIREAAVKGPQIADEEFAFAVALSADATSAVIGAPDGFDDPGGAWAATLGPPPANSFSLGRLWIRADGTFEQQLASSAPGTFTANATVSPRTLHGPTARERRQLRRCHARRRRTAGCPRPLPVTYGTGTMTVSGAGLETVRIAPRRAVRRALDSYRELNVKIAIRFQPATGPKPPAQSRTAVTELGRSESY